MSTDTILIISDDAELLKLAHLGLSMDGYNVVRCRTGQEGLRQARLRKPRLVLLSLSLPDLAGPEICRRLRGDPHTSSALVVVLSEEGEDPDVGEALAAGATDCFPRPSSVEQLQGRVWPTLALTDLPGEAGARSPGATIWSEVEADWLRAQQHFADLHTRIRS